MKLLVGLGNPGPKHAGQRHNVGFMALDRIADRHGLLPWKWRFEGQAVDGAIDGARVLLLKPQTYMNESGRSVGEAARFFRIAPADVIVMHDELDLAPGRIKVKTGGGNAGHNGLRSISTHIGNEFVRVRIGIGHPGSKDLVHGYVLHDFAKADRDWLEPLLDAMAAAIPRLVAGDEARFLTDVATALAPPDPRKATRKKTEVEPVKSSDGPGQRPAHVVEPPATALADRLRSWLRRPERKG